MSLFSFLFVLQLTHTALSLHSDIMPLFRRTPSPSRALTHSHHTHTLLPIPSEPSPYTCYFTNCWATACPAHGSGLGGMGGSRSMVDLPPPSPVSSVSVLSDDGKETGKTREIDAPGMGGRRRRTSTCPAPTSLAPPTDRTALPPGAAPPTPHPSSSFKCYATTCIAPSCSQHTSSPCPSLLRASTASSALSCAVEHGHGHGPIDGLPSAWSPSLPPPTPVLNSSPTAPSLVLLPPTPAKRPLPPVPVLAAPSRSFTAPLPISQTSFLLAPPEPLRIIKKSPSASRLPVFTRSVSAGNGFVSRAGPAGQENGEKQRDGGEKRGARLRSVSGKEGVPRSRSRRRGLVF